VAFRAWNLVLVRLIAEGLYLDRYVSSDCYGVDVYNRDVQKEVKSGVCRNQKCPQ